MDLQNIVEGRGIYSPIPEIMEYAEDLSNPTGTVYAHVPVELVKKLIDEHGGEKINVVQ